LRTPLVSITGERSYNIWMFEYLPRKDNPLDPFLKQASVVTDVAQASAVQVSQYREFTRNSEERNFCLDLCDRIDRVAYAYDRLCELSLVSEQLDDQRRRERDAEGTYTYTPEMQQAEARWHNETDVLTFYIYYELKSIADMLAQWKIVPVSGSELEYALKARDRFLAHPELCRVSPRYSRTKSIPVGGGFTRCDVASLRQWDTITQSVYLTELGMSEPIDRDTEVAKNNRMILGRTANERLDHHDVIRIKAFGAREPVLDRAINELAELLIGAAIERMVAIHKEALERFGFEQFPGVGGPTFSVRLF
jgi:hypothetical protein